jgi:hypothetical protein
MPAISLEVADAIEPAELLQLLVGWLTADPATLSSSLLAYIGHPSYGPDTLRADQDRFTFLLGGSDGRTSSNQNSRNAPRPARATAPTPHCGHFCLA